MSLVQAFALPAARFMVTAWTWLYTLPAPKEEREAHRALVRSDLHEQINDSRNEGLGPVAIAICVILRMLRWSPGDVAWSAPYLSATLVQKLMGTSEAIRRPATLKLLTPWLAFFSVMNGLFVMADAIWPDALAMNGVMLVLTGLRWKQHLIWVRRIVHIWYGLAASMSVGFMVWVVIQLHLYEVPTFAPSMLGALSVGLAMIASEKSVRSRVFKGRWRPVVMCWVVIATTSLATASLLEDGPAILLETWALVALIALAFAMLFGMMILASLCWYGGLRASAAGMRFVAVGIQRIFWEQREP